MEITSIPNKDDIKRAIKYDAVNIKGRNFVSRWSSRHSSAC